jgi:hypothetical protein
MTTARKDGAGRLLNLHFQAETMKNDGTAANDDAMIIEVLEEIALEDGLPAVRRGEMPAN